MNIEISQTPKNAALLRAMASDDWMEAIKARSAFAAYITSPVQEAVLAYPGLRQLFTPYSYNPNEPALLPLAALFDIKTAGFLRVWAQSRAGGLVTSQPTDVSVVPVGTYDLEGAVSIEMDFLRSANTDIIAAYLEQLAQNFTVKSEVNRANVLCGMAAATTYKNKGVDTRQVYRTLTQGTILPQDFNAVNRIMARVNTANVGGTPAGASRSITHVVGSPEFVEEIRNWAWEALNNRNTGGALGAPERMRDGMYDDAGEPSILGAKLITLNDLGQNQAYNIVFASAAGATTYAGYNNGAAVAFSPGSEEVVFCIDRRIRGLASLSRKNEATGSTMKIMTDNQWSNRAETVGFYAKTHEGFVGVDGRGLITMVF